jgi:hypothetical protein
MLHSAKEMEGYAVGATDGVIGHVADFDFDDEAWVVRYLVVDTGGWLSSSKVGVAHRRRHAELGGSDAAGSISREQVRKSPAIDIDKPVSRHHEMMYSGYYGSRITGTASVIGAAGCIRK